MVRESVGPRLTEESDEESLAVDERVQARGRSRL